MNGIRTNAAAVMLGISPNTLRSWERRYGFPKPQRSAGGHRQYSLTEIEALRLTLAETHNVSSAISLARERGEGPSTPSRLTGRFMSFDASSPCDLDAVYAQALEVVLRRAGLRTLALTPAIDLTRLGRALRALTPAAVVLTGHRVALDSIGRLVYAVRSIAREVVVF